MIKKHVLLDLVLILTATVHRAPAQCPIEPTTVFYINGILTLGEDADKDTQLLAELIRNSLSEKYGGAPVPEGCLNVRPAYNPSGGILDLFESLEMTCLDSEAPTLSGPLRTLLSWFRVVDKNGTLCEADVALQKLQELRPYFNMTTLPEDTIQLLRLYVALYQKLIRTDNRDVVIVAHSQGGLFANLQYVDSQLSAPDRARLHIVAVAPPSDHVEGYVRGASRYVTLHEDFVAATVFPTGHLTSNSGNAECAKVPGLLRPHLWCHGFVGAYLNNEESRTDIVEHVTDIIRPSGVFPGTPPLPQNQPPTAGFTMTSVPLLPVPHGQTLSLTVPVGGSATVIFDGSSPRSSDPGGTVTGWQWSINGTLASTASSFSRSFTVGIHSIRLVVTDNEGAPSQPAVATVQVQATQPVSSRSRWTLQNVLFSDGGTATGSFVHDASLNRITEWNINVNGGGTAGFPALTYSPFSSYLRTVAELGFVVPRPNSRDREIRLSFGSPLTSAGGTIDFGGIECISCSPFRTFSGVVSGQPIPANQRPTAGFTMTSIPLQPVSNGKTLKLAVPVGGNAAVTFDGAPPHSSDIDGVVTEWHWFINGITASSVSSFSRALSAGVYNVHLVVSDSQGTLSLAAISSIEVNEIGWPVSPTWSQLFVTPQPSEDRQASAMAFDDTRGEMVLFGGQSLRFASPFADTWAWNGTAWTQKTPLHPPPPMSGHAMAYDSVRRQIVMVGGTSTSGMAQTWVWDGTDWQQMITISAPSSRVGHRMVFDSARGVVVLIGTNSIAQFDTWEWDGSIWREIVAPGGRPTARTGFSLAYDRIAGRTVLFGGFKQASGTYSNETWTWNGATWTLQNPQNSPSARAAAAMTFDPVTQSVILVGGDNGLRDTWRWTGSTWIEINIGGTLPPSIPNDASLQSAALVGDGSHTASLFFGGGNKTWAWKVPAPTDTTKTFAFSGFVTQVTDNHGILSNIVPVGSPLSGILRYEVGEVDRSFGLYAYRSGLTNISVNFNTPSGQQTVATSFSSLLPPTFGGFSSFIGVDNDNPSDVFSIRGLGVPSTWQLPVPSTLPLLFIPSLSIEVNLLDEIPPFTLLTGGAIPSTLDFTQVSRTTCNIRVSTFAETLYSVSFVLTTLNQVSP